MLNFKELKNFILPPKYLVIHHTASADNATKEEIHQWHLDKGWSGIAYHKLIWLDGHVEQGRPDAVIGAHAYGFNQRSFGICCVGDFQKNKPSKAMLRSLIQVCAILCKRYGIPAENVIAHRDVLKKFGQGEATACPGNYMYLHLGFIRSEVAKYL